MKTHPSLFLRDVKARVELSLASSLTSALQLVPDITPPAWHLVSLSLRLGQARFPPLLTPDLLVVSSQEWVLLPWVIVPCQKETMVEVGAGHDLKRQRSL